MATIKIATESRHNPFQAPPNFLVGERETMSNHIYRVIEIVGTSPDGIDAAIRNSLARAAETMRLLDWFEVQSVRGDLRNGAVAHFQVTLKVGFRLEDAE
jgi:flavin-binding protein dodecin